MFAWWWQISNSNPPTNRTTRHLYGHSDYSGRVKRGSKTLREILIFAFTLEQELKNLFSFKMNFCGILDKRKYLTLMSNLKQQQEKALKSNLQKLIRIIMFVRHTYTHPHNATFSTIWRWFLLNCFRIKWNLMRKIFVLFWWLELKWTILDFQAHTRSYNCTSLD